MLASNPVTPSTTECRRKNCFEEVTCTHTPHLSTTECINIKPFGTSLDVQNVSITIHNNDRNKPHFQQLRLVAVLDNTVGARKPQIDR